MLRLRDVLEDPDLALRRFLIRLYWRCYLWHWRRRYPERGLWIAAIPYNFRTGYVRRTLVLETQRFRLTRSGNLVPFPESGAC